MLTLTNEGPTKVDNYYFNIDYIRFEKPLEDAGYFHAQYRQQAPCRGWTDNWKSNGEPQIENQKNLEGKENYVFFEAEGRGHFLGVTQAVLQNQDDCYREGDEMIFIDGSELPVINGTGTEDYFNGSWDYKGPTGPAQSYSYLSIGTPFVENAEKLGGRYCSYRWHLEGPIPFRRSIKVTIEHGHANHRSDNFYTVGYWYQTEPHKIFPVLPKVEDRIPRVFAVGGPGAGSAVALTDILLNSEWVGQSVSKGPGSHVTGMPWWAGRVGGRLKPNNLADRSENKRTIAKAKNLGKICRCGFSRNPASKFQR